MLRANVMTPRIFWYDFRRAMASVFRFALVAAAVVAAGWGVWRGVEVALLENEDFRLRRIVINENPALDEIRLLEVTRLDLEGSLFACDPDEIRGQLEALPEIVSAKVLREFPGDLKIRVKARQPYVWIACEAVGRAPRDPASGLLVDRSGHLFPCPQGMFGTAAELPVLHLRDDDGGIVPGEVIEHPDYHRALRLLQVAERHLPEAREWIDSIKLYKRWGCKIHTRDGTEATFGHDDLDRQMQDLLAAVEHARQKGVKIATICLIGSRNLPVTYQSATAPRAIIVSEEKAAPTGDADLPQLLER